MSLCRLYSLPTRGLFTDGYLTAHDLSSQKMITLVRMLWVFHTQRHTCPFVLKKEKTARVASRMHLNANRTQPALSPTCQIHQATQKFHRYEERQDVTAVF